MKSIALVYCPGDWELAKPPAGIAYLSSYIKEKGYRPELFDYNVELLVSVTVSEYRQELLCLVEGLKTGKAYDIGFLERYYFFMQLNYKYLLKQIGLLKEYESKSEDLGNSCDHSVYDFFIQRAEALSKFDVVGLSVIFDDQIDSAFCLALLIRKFNPKCRIVVGGTAVSLKDFKSVADMIILGDGEVQLYAYLRHLDHNEALPPMKVHIHKDLKTLPVPDYASLFLKYDYVSPVKVISLPVTRGCYWGRCLFCSYGWVESNTEKAAATYRKLPAGEVASQMEFFYTELGIRHFFFSVDASDANHLNQIAEEIIQRGMKVYWRTEIRSEKNFLNDSLLQKLYQSGCRTISFGLESVNQRVLDKMNKGVASESVSELVQRLAKANIGINTDFFIGFPTETPEEASETQQFVYDRNEVLLSHSSGGTFIVFAKSKIARDREFDGLKFVPETGSWFKKGMSFSEQERQQRVFAVNLITDRRYCKFPVRNDGVFFFIYTSKYSVGELRSLLRNSYGFIKVYQQANQAFEFTLFYLGQWGLDINCRKCMEFCRTYFESLGARIPENKQGLLDLHLDIMKKAVGFFRLQEERQSFLEHTLMVDYYLLAACISSGRIPSISRSRVGDFEIRELDSLYLIPAAELTRVYVKSFQEDLNLILKREAYKNITQKNTYAIFDINGIHITYNRLAYRLLSKILEKQGRWPVRKIIDTFFPLEEEKDIIASLRWLRDEGILKKGIAGSKPRVEDLLELMNLMEKGEIDATEARKLI